MSMEKNDIIHMMRKRIDALRFEIKWRQEDEDYLEAEDGFRDGRIRSMEEEIESLEGMIQDIQSP